jgi:hypothetical protein
MEIDGDSAAIVDDGNATILVNDDGDLVAETTDGLVDGVIDDLIDEVVQAGGTGGPDIHCWSFSDRVEAFEDLD